MVRQVFVGFIQRGVPGPGTVLAHSTHIISVCWVNGGIKDSNSPTSWGASVWPLCSREFPKHWGILAEGPFHWSWAWILKGVGLLFSPHPGLNLSCLDSQSSCIHLMDIHIPFSAPGESNLLLYGQRWCCLLCLLTGLRYSTIHISTVQCNGRSWSFLKALPPCK